MTYDRPPVWLAAGPEDADGRDAGHRLPGGLAGRPQTVRCTLEWRADIVSQKRREAELDGEETRQADAET